MIDETLEFEITQYLDGELPPGAVAALEERLKVDPDAREVLEQYRKLNGVMTSAVPVPAMNWDRLSARISSAVDEEFEYSLMEYLDGGLPSDEKTGIESRVSQDARAAATLDEYRNLDKVLSPTTIEKSWPLPEVKWELLASHISDAVAEESQASRMRIGNWGRNITRIALAACLLVGVGLWTKFHGRPTDTHVAVNVDPPGKVVPENAVAQLDVTVTGPSAAAGPAVAEVEILAPTLAQKPSRSAESYALEGFASGPTHIELIAPGADASEDSLRTPY